MQNQDRNGAPPPGSELLRQFVESVPVPVAMFDRDMRFLMVSRRFGVAYNVHPHDLVGRRHYDVFPDLPEHWRAAHRLGLSGIPSSREEEAFERADGSIDWLRWEVQPWTATDGTVGGIVLFTEFITARKRAEAELAAMEERLRQERSMTVVGRLAGGVAHDLNNLLTPIIGYGDLLAGAADLNAKQRSYAEEIAGAGRRAIDMVQRLLAFSQRLPLDLQPRGLNAIVDEARPLLRRALPDHVELDVQLATALPPVLADGHHLGRALLELALNAADAMSDGGRLRIATGVSAADAEGGPGGTSRVLLTVQDTGRGMDSETAAHAFEPFYSRNGRSGAGLGLSVVQGIVAQHRGQVRLASEPGLGTRVEISLPAAPADDSAR